MTSTNPHVDAYLANGCGRCPLGGTIDCKVHRWQAELALLREIILECGLTEELKWKHPCYTFQHKNVLLLGAFTEYCVLSFIKGALLQDSHHILVKQGENSHEGRVFQVKNIQQIIDNQEILREYILQAVAIEKAGLKVPTRKVEDFVFPAEFQQKLTEMPALQRAFEGLTPGRQKGYLLYFAGAKQAKTREARVEKYLQKILEGKGLED